MKKQPSGPTIRLDKDIAVRVWRKCVDENRPLTRVLNDYLRGWIEEPVASTPGPTLVRKDETPPSDLVKQLSSLQALAEQLAAGIKDAATNTRGLIDARNTNDAGPAGRARVEADVLRAVAEADRSAGAAIKDAAPRRRRSKGHDTGAA